MTITISGAQGEIGGQLLDGQIAGPGLPKRGGQVIFPGGMVDDMRSPEPIDLVTAAVKPIIGEVIGEKGQRPMPPVRSIEREQPPAVEK